MNNEDWIELNTIESVAMAKGDGWEIEFRSHEAYKWSNWTGNSWDSGWKFRGRPARPKTKTVKLLAYLDLQGEFRRVNEKSFTNSNWIRVTSEDKEIEVPDEN